MLVLLFAGASAGEPCCYCMYVAYLARSLRKVRMMFRTGVVHRYLHSSQGVHNNEGREHAIYAECYRFPHRS